MKLHLFRDNSWNDKAYTEINPIIILPTIKYHFNYNFKIFHEMLIILLVHYD